MTIMTTVIEGPATLSFNWRVSSEANFDFLASVSSGEDTGWVDNVVILSESEPEPEETPRGDGSALPPIINLLLSSDSTE